MKRLFLAAPLALMCLQAHSIGRLAEVTIIDRATGNALPASFHRGEYWVAGAPGARYAIEIHNHQGERILAVTSVDGVNVVSGETAAWSQSGYVYAPGQSYEITGWRKSNEEVAAFQFTAAPNSYAARTGRAANIGVIGVALFRERTPPILPMIGQLEDRADAAGSAAAAGEAAANQAAQSPSARLGAATSSLERIEPGLKLGTGHGQREGSHVDNVDFERLQNSPNEVVRIRYDSTENLIAMGVIRRPAPPLAAPSAFPDSPLARYVPDPPGYR